MKSVLLPIPKRHSINQDLASLWNLQTQGKTCHRRFARAGLANQGGNLALANLNVNACKRLYASRVVEIQVFEFNAAFQPCKDALPFDLFSLGRLFSQRH